MQFVLQICYLFVFSWYFQTETEGGMGKEIIFHPKHGNYNKLFPEIMTSPLACSLTLKYVPHLQKEKFKPSSWMVQAANSKPDFLSCQAPVKCACTLCYHQLAHNFKVKFLYLLIRLAYIFNFFGT